MQSNDCIIDLIQSLYQNMDSTKDIWKAFQDLKIGADKSLWLVHADAQKKSEKDHRICLVVKELNPDH